MNITPLSQRDPKWGNKYLGFSKLKISGFGCTLTALTMLLNYLGYSETPLTVNENLKKVNAFQGALILWANVSRAYPKVKWIKRGYNYNNFEVALYVYVKRIPVLVEVNGAKIGASTHWVLFIGNGKANDPWTGKEISTNYYPLTGYSLFEKVK